MGLISMHILETYPNHGGKKPKVFGHTSVAVDSHLNKLKRC